MAGKPDKERMGQDMKYVIDSKTYENHINDEVHLYGLLHQLAFLAEKAKDEKDLENLAETAKRYERSRRKSSPPGVSPAAIWCLGTGRILRS